MSAKDVFHDAVKNALIKDGWTITHDPLSLKWDEPSVSIDLGAERVIAAEKNEQKIAVEIKSFVSASVMEDLEKAVGQYMIYLIALGETGIDRELYLAVPENIVKEVLSKPMATKLLKRFGVHVIGYDAKKEEIVRWIH